MKAFFGFTKKHKVLTIIVLSLVVLAAAGFTAFKIIIGSLAQPPEIQTSPDDFEYDTLSSLQDVFYVSDAEKARSITSYSEQDGFSVYKRAFNNFMAAGKYRVVTTGQTEASGILVNIRNEKKFDGTYFFMHLKSSAANAGTLANLSNNEALHYIYVTGNNTDNLATIKNLDVNNPSVVKRKTVCSEKDYVYNYGAIPYIACNFIIRENTVEKSKISFDAESGLYKIEMVLNAVESTKGLVKQMHAVSGTDASYEKGSVTYTAYVDDGFIIRRADIAETYNVSTLGLSFSGVSNTSDEFSYEGDRNFIPIAEDEKYDLKDVPVKENDTEIAETKKISARAVNNVTENGMNADFVLSVENFDLKGKIQAEFGDAFVVRIDTEINKTPVSVFISLDDTKSGVLIADVDGFKAGVEFTRLGDVVSSLLPALGVDLKGFNVGKIINSIDFAELAESFGNVKGTKSSENAYLFDTNFNKTGLPLDIPIKMTVQNGKIVSFVIDRENVMGTVVYLSLTPSKTEKDLENLTIDQTTADFSGLIDYALNNLDFPLVKEIIENKRVAVNLNAEVSGFNISGTAAIGLSDLSAPEVFAEINVDGLNLSVFYKNGTLFIKNEKVAVSLSVETLKDYVSIFTGKELDISSFIEDLKDDIKDIIKSLTCGENGFSLSYNDLALSVSADNIRLNYGENISAEISALSCPAEIPAPTGNFVSLEGLKPLLTKINTQLSTRYFTANGSIEFGNTSVALDGFVIDFGGELKDLFSAQGFNINAGGTIAATIDGKTYELAITYANGNIYADYDGIKVKIGKSSLNNVVDFLKNNYQTILENTEIKNTIENVTDAIDGLRNDLSVSAAFEIIKTLSVENGKLTLSVNGGKFGIDGDVTVTAGVENDNLSVRLNLKDVNANFSVGNAQTGVTFSDTDYKDFSGLIDYALNNLDFPLVKEIIENKRVAVNLNAEVSGFNISGTAAIGLNDLSAPEVFAEINVDGLNLSVFYKNGTLFIKNEKVAVSLSVETLKDYVSIFTGKELEISSFIEDLKDDIKDIIKSLTCGENGFSLSYNDFALSVSAGNISLNYGENISAEISALSCPAEIPAPTGNFVSLEGLKPLLTKINTQLSTRYFTANGSIAFGNTTVRFENVKIINLGSTENPTESFNKGLLTLSGTVYITANGTTHKLFIQYTDATLFIVYNDEMKIKLSRASMDSVVDLIKNNYKEIINRFNYSEIISADDTLTKLRDYTFTIGSVTKLLQKISVSDGGFAVTLKAADFGFTENAVLRAYMKNNGDLALDVTIGNKNGNVSLNNATFAKPAAPTGNFIDFSGITGLAEAAVNAILKKSEQYYLSGTAKIVLLGKTVTMDMDASVRLVSDGKGGKKIEAVAHVSLYDWAVSTFAGSYIKCGKGTLVYKNETFYIRRINEYQLFGWRTDSDTRRAMTRSYFGKNLMQQIGYFVGFTDKLIAEFTAKKETHIERCLNSYSATSSEHTLKLNGSALTGSSELGEMTAVIGITNKQLTSLKVTIPISVSILSMTATINLTHNPSANGDFTDANNLNPSLFGTVLK